jgi:hypothetical protein
MKEKNVMVKVARYNPSKDGLEDMIVHINECTDSDKKLARCPECDERVMLKLRGEQKHYVHDNNKGKPCSFKPAEPEAPTWESLTEDDISQSLKDLQKHRLKLSEIQTRYSGIEESNPLFVEFSNHLYNLKLVFKHALLLKYGFGSEEDPKTEYFEALLVSMGSPQWRIIRPELLAYEQNVFEPKTPEDEFIMRMIRQRRGKPEFRNLLIGLYKGKCCVTGCSIESILEAVQIGPDTEDSSEFPQGVLMRTDIHNLFDLKMIIINPDYSISVSPALKGSEYEKYHGKMISLPSDEKYFPLVQDLAKKAG